MCGRECPKCNQSKLENEITCNFPDFINQKEFEWLKYKKPMKLDFYDDKSNTAIECQGIQHFIPLEIFGGVDGYNKNVFRDKLKYDLCEKHNIEIVYYFPEEFLEYENHFYDDKNCFHTIDDLIKYIKTRT